ncbi:MAG: hypothetical protein KDB02_07845, partial [Acidimicrobiales bacterium]|nr:hypothetical protein [Acidimicrobiales bacterium]
MDRRQFLRAMTAGGIAMSGAGFLSACIPDVPEDFGLTSLPFGGLNPPDENGLMLLDGFTSRVIATTGEVVAGTGYTWHPNPDGGACFADPGTGGWIYVSNSETTPVGGASMIRFD